MPSRMAQAALAEGETQEDEFLTENMSNRSRFLIYLADDRIQAAIEAITPITPNNA